MDSCAQAVEQLAHRRQALLDGLGVVDAAGQPHIEAYQGSATALPFADGSVADGSFEAALSATVLEALAEPGRPYWRCAGCCRAVASWSRIRTTTATRMRVPIATWRGASTWRLRRRAVQAMTQATDTCGLFTEAGFCQAELRVLPLVETEYGEPHLGPRIAQLGPRGSPSMASSSKR